MSGGGLAAEAESGAGIFFPAPPLRRAPVELRDEVGGFSGLAFAASSSFVTSTMQSAVHFKENRV